MSVAEYARTWHARIAASASQVLVAENGNDVVGWIAGCGNRDPECDPTTLEIFGIYVDPQHWRKGIGRNLWTGFQTRFAPNSRITLWVLEDNQSARRFYEHVGFIADPGARKEIDLGGAALIELRYVRGGA